MKKVQAYLWLLNCTQEELNWFLEDYYFAPDFVSPEFFWAYTFLINTFGEGQGIHSALY